MKQKIPIDHYFYFFLMTSWHLSLTQLTCAAHGFVGARDVEFASGFAAIQRERELSIARANKTASFTGVLLSSPEFDQHIACLEIEGLFIGRNYEDARARGTRERGEAPASSKLNRRLLRLTQPHNSPIIQVSQTKEAKVQLYQLLM